MTHRLLAIIMAGGYDVYCVENVKYCAKKLVMVAADLNMHGSVADDAAVIYTPKNSILASCRWRP